MQNFLAVSSLCRIRRVIVLRLWRAEEGTRLYAPHPCCQNLRGYGYGLLLLIVAFAPITVHSIQFFSVHVSLHFPRVSRASPDLPFIPDWRRQAEADFDLSVS